MTVLDALIQSLSRAGEYNRDDQVPPAVILWPDKERQWEPLMPVLRERLAHLLTLGTYDVGTRTGPGVWLRCMIARSLPEAKWTEKDIPVIYLPGVSRQELRAVAECPAPLMPLAELQYRGAFWSQVNHKDWTVLAFLQSSDGWLGLDVARDTATLEAMNTALVKLAETDVRDLAGHRLEAQDFQPWLDADTIRRQGKSIESVASDTAEQWREGLKEWGIDQAKIKELTNAAHYAVYTPGSDAGLQISVLSSLEAPEIPWEGNKEILREKISSTVTALLGLVGYDDIDPLRSREHILLSNIFEYTWSQGKSLDLTELIIGVQKPPFEKLGAFAIDNFFPAKERNQLALTLNNILASPAFQAWREGEPMDVKALLFAPDGKPRHNVFYIAHLSDGERMFFVTLLLSAIETWMRTQSGSISLRALVYFDELYGYLPPTAMPPSKTPLLRMLKQARAFGVGMVLATQNPVDVDYKALSNAGSWFVGKLQTERDKNRLLDGLQSASADLDRNAYSEIISALGKRVFLLHNIHSNGAVLFQTRWTMNFLAGPLTRPQIPALNQLVGAISASKLNAGMPVPFSIQSEDGADLSHFQPISKDDALSAPVDKIKSQSTYATRQASESEGSLTRPLIPSGISEYFLPVTYSLTEAFKMASEPIPVDSRLESILYRATLLSCARVRFIDRRYGVDSEVVRDAIVDSLDRRTTVRWDDYPYDGPDMEKLEDHPGPQARFIAPDASFVDIKLINALQKDFIDWVYRTTQVTARANLSLKIFAGPDISPAEFRTTCSNAARQSRDTELSKFNLGFERQLAILKDKLDREERKLSQSQLEYDNRKQEETGNLLELGAGILGFGRKKSITTQISRSRLSQQARADVDNGLDVLNQVKEQIQNLEQNQRQNVKDINERWAGMVNQVTEIPILPKKNNIYVQIFGVAWKPFYIVSGGGDIYELPAFGSG